MQIYRHTHIPFIYWASHRTGIGLYEFLTPPSSSRTAQPSDQVKSKFLCLTFKILLPPICLSNCITNSPEPLSPLCSSLSPNIPAPSHQSVLLSMLFRSCHPFLIIIKPLPVFGVGGWREGSPSSSLPCAHATSPGLGHCRGQGTGSAFSVSPQCWDVTSVNSARAPPPMLSTSEYILKLFVCLFLWLEKKGPEMKGLA